MSDNDILIKVENVSKKFCRSLKRSLWYGVQDIARELMPAKRDQNAEQLKSSFQRSGSSSNVNVSGLRPHEFYAMRDVSFELRRGECLGLIGRNGAGKTTLLKVLNGLIKPDGGRITMRGRVGALIALGAGFNPILTGRENIYVNASVLGLSKREIDAKLDEIIDFAEIGEFIDSPVQSYSSGMQVRLGFAVATTLEPDILLLDEVLAVGDAGFRHKCYSRIGRLQRNAAVIFVSHSMEFISQICDRVLYMQHGHGTFHPQVTNGIAAYVTENQAQDAESAAGLRTFYPPITSAELELDRDTVSYGDTIEVRLTLEMARAFRNPVIGLALRSETENVAAIWNTRQHGIQVEIPAGRSEVRFPVGPLHLLPGKYNCSLSVREDGSAAHTLWFYNQAQFRVQGQGQPMSEVSVLLPYQGHTLEKGTTG